MGHKTIVKYILALIILITCNLANSQSAGFTLEDINKLTTLSNLEISPDGSQVLFITSKRDMATNTFKKSAMVMDIVSKELQPIDEDIQGMGSLKWMEEGKAISFVADGDNGRQVHILDLSNKMLRKVTNSSTGVLRYEWSPDENQLAYLARDNRVTNLGKNKFNDSFEVGSNDFLVDKTPLNTSVWMVGADGQEAKKITPNGFTVATGLSTSALSWSPDGSLLAFTKYPTSFSGDSDLGINYIYNIDTEELRVATSNTQRESGPIFNPNGKSLLFNYPRDGFPSNMRDLYELDLKTGKTSNITMTLDRSVSDIQWLSDGTVLLRGIDKWGNAIWKLENGKGTKIEVGEIASVAGWSVAREGSMVLLGIKRDYPTEIYYKENLNAIPLQLTDFNGFVKDIQLGNQKGLEWDSSDGLRPTGIITYPPNFDPEKRYPLVLQVHGGPSASSLLGFSPVTQAMAAKGWIVFQPNYRGSTNLGNEFQSAISKDPSEGPGHDVITGVEALKGRPYVNPDKIAVSGWSYGGWMTAWLIGRYPEVWAAAVAGAAPVDLTDMYSLNDLNRMRRHSMVESPYVGNNLDWAYKNSPIINFSKIKTPTLIMSKTGDFRVTITGSYKLYGALRDNDIPTQFIAYPGPGHFPRDPVRSLDVYKRWIGWLDKYLTDDDSSK